MGSPDRLRIAVVDDEEHLRTTLSQALVQEGFAVLTFGDGLAAWGEFEKSLPDLVILDIIMPRMDGLELCRRIRSLSDRVPILFLTSRDEEFDRVLGLELGADDYLCKPFSLRELIARVRVLFRRGAPAAEKAASEAACLETVRQGRLVMDGERFTAAWGGVPIRLTVTEFRILSALARRPGIVLSREELLAQAFPQDAYMSDRTVDCHLKRIRRKIGEKDPAFDGIETVYGLGYRWREER